MINSSVNPFNSLLNNAHIDNLVTKAKQSCGTEKDDVIYLLLNGRADAGSFLYQSPFDVILEIVNNISLSDRDKIVQRFEPECKTAKVAFNMDLLASIRKAVDGDSSDEDSSWD